MSHALKQHGAAFLKTAEKNLVQRRTLVKSYEMNIYKHLANSQVFTKINIVLNSQHCTKAVLNKLFNDFYRFTICGFILEKSFLWNISVSFN